MKTTKSPFKSGNSIALILPDWLVKSKGITAKSRLTIKDTKQGFNVRVKR